MGQCPQSSASSHFSCVSSGGNTQITLFDDVELAWDRFEVPAGETLSITGGFTSRHLSTQRAVVAGDIQADGSFTLIAPSGLSVSGEISAPSVLLSTLPLVEDGAAFEAPRRVGQAIVQGGVEATAGDATLLGSVVRVTGSVKAPSGTVRIIATDRDRVSSSDFSRQQNSAAFSNSRVQAQGDIEGAMVEIYTSGFLTNRGRIAGQSVDLEASLITHVNTPGSVIESNMLTLNPNFALDGELVGFDDGSNPGGVSTTLGFPDLESGSFVGKEKTKLLPTQFSASQVSRSQLPSALAVKKKKSAAKKTRVVTRGTKKKVKKRSFFGAVKKER